MFVRDKKSHTEARQAPLTIRRLSDVPVHLTKPRISGARLYEKPALERGMRRQQAALQRLGYPRRVSGGCISVQSSTRGRAI